MQSNSKIDQCVETTPRWNWPKQVRARSNYYWQTTLCCSFPTPPWCGSFSILCQKKMGGFIQTWPLRTIAVLTCVFPVRMRYLRSELSIDLSELHQFRKNTKKTTNQHMRFLKCKTGAQSLRRPAGETKIQTQRLANPTEQGYITSCLAPTRRKCDSSWCFDMFWPFKLSNIYMICILIYMLCIYIWYVLICFTV